VYVLQSSLCSTSPRKRPNFVERRKGEVQVEMHGLPKIHLLKE
jgi:hypothetical protein